VACIAGIGDEHVSREAFVMHHYCEGMRQFRLIFGRKFLPFRCNAQNMAAICVRRMLYRQMTRRCQNGISALCAGHGRRPRRGFERLAACAAPVGGGGNARTAKILRYSGPDRELVRRRPNRFNRSCRGKASFWPVSRRPARCRHRSIGMALAPEP
jgi:hypothetical protein